MAQPYELTACEAVEQLRKKNLSAVELVTSCLDRIEALDGTIAAWTYVDRDGALARAKAVDATPGDGAMRGVPIGIKDVIETADMPTEYGTPIFAGWKPATDAACVARAKSVGAIVLGKHVTQAFACGAPVRTANPLNPDHTSGGSSSGSVAAVAAKMVPVAFGTQSASSLIRPASYNGLVGMRPSVGLISTTGFKPFTASFDTIGLLGRRVDDVELLWTSQLGVPFTPGRKPSKRLKIGICRPPWLDRAEPSALAAIDKAERCFGEAGAEVREIVLPASYPHLLELHEQIHDFEGSRSYAYEYDHHRDQLDNRVKGLIERGRALSGETYLDAMAQARKARAEFPDVIGDCDAIVTAAAPGEAPKGYRALGERFEIMGDPAQSRAWTLLQVPVVTVPCHKGPAGLPVGVQLIGRFGSDLALLSDRALGRRGHCRSPSEDIRLIRNAPDTERKDHRHAQDHEIVARRGGSDRRIASRRMPARRMTRSTSASVSSFRAWTAITRRAAKAC